MTLFRQRAPARTDRKADSTTDAMTDAATATTTVATTTAARRAARFVDVTSTVIVTVVTWCLVATTSLAEGATPTAIVDESVNTAPGWTDVERTDLLAQIDRVGRRGFLYRVTRATGSESTSDRGLFLYGTVHLGRIGSEPFNAPVVAALRQSRQLAIEADPTDEPRTRVLAMQLGRYDDGDGLQRHVPPELMARVVAFGSRNGIPADRVDRFKPWLLATMVALTQLNGAGLDPALGSELYLTGFARSRQMPIVEIEGVETQLRMLASLPDAMQSAQLDEALSDIDSAASQAQEQTKALFDLWLDGDRRAGDVLVADMHRDANGKPFERFFVDQLIDRRNRTMADKAETYLEKPGNTFFAVGSLHLFGDAGLLREFERRGYRIVDLQAPVEQR